MTSPATNPTDLAIATCKTVMDSLPDVPIVMQHGVYPRYTYIRNEPGMAVPFDQWSVRLRPGHSDVSVSGSGAAMFGVNDCIGETVQLVFENFDGGITGVAFADALAEAIRAKYAEVTATAAA